MDSLGHVLLAAIAVGSLMQAAVMIGALVGARRLGGRMESRMAALEQELRGQLARIGVLVDHIERLAEGLQRQMPEIESALGDATERMRRTGEAVERVVRGPVGLVAAAMVFTAASRFVARRRDEHDSGRK